MIILCNDFILNNKIGGNAIRMIQLAKLIENEGEKIVLFDPKTEDTVVDSILIKKLSFKSLISEINNHDTIIITPSMYFINLAWIFKLVFKKKIIFDLFDPLLNSGLIQYKSLKNKIGFKNYVSSQLKHKYYFGLGDSFICSTYEQYVQYAQTIMENTRFSDIIKSEDINRILYNIPTLPMLNFTTTSNDSNLINKLSKLTKRKLLWYGKVLLWYDFDKFIELVNNHHDVIGVIVGVGKDESRKLKQRLADTGILEKFIIFDEWLNINELCEIIKQSNYTVVTVHNTIEDTCSYRSRILLSLSQGVKVITNSSNFLINLFENKLIIESYDSSFKKLTFEYDRSIVKRFFYEYYEGVNAQELVKYKKIKISFTLIQFIKIQYYNIRITYIYLFLKLKLNFSRKSI